MIIQILKILHIVSVIFWTGVLLYVPWLLVWQTEANTKTEPERTIVINYLKVLTKKLWVWVGWPSMGIVILLGLGLMHPYFSMPWFWVKMGFVVALMVHHHIIHFAFKNLQKDNYTKSVVQLKAYSQTSFVLTLAIVALAVLKSTVNYLLMIGSAALIIVFLILFSRFLMKKK